MSAPLPYIKPGERVIIYDGVCALCTGWVNFLIRHDRRHTVRLSAVQSKKGRALLEWAGLPTDKINTLVLIENQQVYLRSEAIFRVIANLPWPWRILGVLRIFPRPLRDRCYDGIALNRYRLFGRYDAVRTLKADHDRRFL
ncbi:thiol-disulfide oxidoreductase DCC family protein [Yersinia pseudotuberculosis]|uniref:thiol-disulfide oxidoreductase DCC family protein n=1 Tax=Yersinia pseudotuberculosis TaxID=633 RepID=UPI0038B5D514